MAAIYTTIASASVTTMAILAEPVAAPVNIASIIIGSWSFYTTVNVGFSIMKNINIKKDFEERLQREVEQNKEKRFYIGKIKEIKEILSEDNMCKEDPVALDKITVALMQKNAFKDISRFYASSNWGEDASYYMEGNEPISAKNELADLLQIKDFRLMTVSNLLKNNDLNPLNEKELNAVCNSLDKFFIKQNSKVISEIREKNNAENNDIEMGFPDSENKIKPPQKTNIFNYSRLC
jgi:hypothetical protein